MVEESTNLSRIVLKIESMIREELAGLPMEETTRLLLKIHQKLEEIRISVEESGACKGRPGERTHYTLYSYILNPILLALSCFIWIPLPLEVLG